MVSLALKVERLKSFRVYFPLLLAFLLITFSSLIVTYLSEGNPGLLTSLAVSPKNWWGAVTSLFANYKMEYAFSNIIGLTVYFLLFSLGNAFLSREERSKRFLFFSVTIFVAGIVANSLFLLTVFLVPSLQGPSIGTSALVYGVAGSASAFAIFNFFSVKNLVKHKVFFFWLWITNPFILLLSSIDLYRQLSGATNFFVAYQVNIFVHYYAFSTGLMISLVWLLLAYSHSPKAPR